jgi:hypothetical protein
MNLDNISNIKLEGENLSHIDANTCNDDGLNFKIRKTNVTKLIRHLSHELFVKLHKLIIPIVVCSNIGSESNIT